MRNMKFVDCLTLVDKEKRKVLENEVCSQNIQFVFIAFYDQISNCHRQQRLYHPKCKHSLQILNFISNGILLQHTQSKTLANRYINKARICDSDYIVSFGNILHWSSPTKALSAKVNNVCLDCSKNEQICTKCWRIKCDNVARSADVNAAKGCHLIHWHTIVWSFSLISFGIFSV